MKINFLKKLGFITVIVLITICIISTSTPAIAKGKPTFLDASVFHDDMRKLWEDHITWTRNFIISTFSNLSDQAPVAQRLLQNQDDIGNAVKQFYGEAGGEQLSNLLRDHILIAAEMLVAARDGDSTTFVDASTRWYQNGNEIASFLNSINPEFWPLQEMETMMDEHLDLTLLEAVSRLTGNYTAEIAAYDQIHLQALEMADMLSNGIINQFPKKFSKRLILTKGELTH